VNNIIKTHGSQRQQKGIALLSVMLIVVIVAALATQMHWDQRISTKRIQNMLILDQSQHFAQGAENWAREFLIEDARNSNFDHLQEDWAQALPPLPIEGGLIQGRLIDLQGLFNLNNLIDTKGMINEEAVNQFRILLQTIEVDSEISNAIADWIDSDNYPTFPGGAEDPSYSSLNAPYKTANHYLTDISELMSIKGITSEIYRRLSPLVSALPIGTAININTAPAEVLMTISENLTQQNIDYIVEQRELSPFENIQEFTELLSDTTNIDISKIVTPLTTDSNYFLAELEVQLFERLYRRHSYLYRDVNTSVASYQRIHSPDRLIYENLNEDGIDEENTNVQNSNIN